MIHKKGCSKRAAFLFYVSLTLKNNQERLGVYVLNKDVRDKKILQSLSPAGFFEVASGFEPL